MLFSVVIPIYNAEAYIFDCVDSIIRQCRDRAEILLVNDGSTDGSGCICRKMQEENPKIVKVLEQENGGQMAARMAGIAAAVGDYIILLDADDMLRFDALDVIEKCLAESHAEMVLYEISSDRSFAPVHEYLSFPDGTVFEGDKRKEIYRMFFSGNRMNSMVSKAYKRSLFDGVTMTEEEKNIRNGEDLLHLLKFFGKAKKMVYLRQCLYWYRANPGSVTNNYQSNFYYSRKIIYRKLSECMDSWEMDRATTVKLLDAKIVAEVCQVVSDASSQPKIVLIQKLKEISNDPWFTELYQRTEKGKLDIRRRVVLMLLYRKCLYSLYLIIRFKAKMKIVNIKNKQ